MYNPPGGLSSEDGDVYVADDQTIEYDIHTDEQVVTVTDE